LDNIVRFPSQKGRGGREGRRREGEEKGKKGRGREELIFFKIWDIHDMCARDLGI
jgi:hypothetical protein